MREHAYAVQYTTIFIAVKIQFPVKGFNNFLFLAEAVLRSTHILRFRTKTKEKMFTLVHLSLTV